MGVHTITHPPRDRSHTNILYPPCLPYILGAASPIFQQVQAPARGAGAGGPAVPPITTVEIGTDLLDGTNLIAWRADLQPGAPQLSAEVGGRAAVPTQPHMPTTLVVLNPGDREMPSPDAISDKEIRASPRPSFLGLAPDRTPAGAAPPPSQPAIANGTPPPGNTSSWGVADLILNYHAVSFRSSRLASRRASRRSVWRAEPAAVRGAAPAASPSASSSTMPPADDTSGDNGRYNDSNTRLGDNIEMT